MPVKRGRYESKASDVKLVFVLHSQFVLGFLSFRETASPLESLKYPQTVRQCIGGIGRIAGSALDGRKIFVAMEEPDHVVRPH